MEQRLETVILALGLVIVVSIFTVTSLDVVWRGEFEGQDVALMRYEASTYDPTRGTNPDLGGVTHATIDPDGSLKYGVFLPEKGQGTGLHIALGVPAPVNYENGRYVQVFKQADWRPSEQWEVTISGNEYAIAVYRMIGGITVTTTTTRPEKGLDECNSIKDLSIYVNVNLPTWTGTEETYVGMGMIYIPREAEVQGTVYGPPVKTELIDYKQQHWLWGLFTDISFNSDPYIAPQVPGTMLYGTEVTEGQSPIGAPKSVQIPFKWASIKPGVQDTGFIAEERAEVSEAIQFVIVFMASRPLYAAAAAGGSDPGEGGAVQPPITCGLLQDPIYDANGQVMACQYKDFGGLKRFVLLIVVILFAGLAIILILKWLVTGVILRRR